MNRPFWRGVAIGALVSAAFFLGALYRLSAHGVTVTLDTAGLAAQVRREVAGHVRRELPGVLTRLQTEVPPAVARQVADRFDGDRIDLGGITVQVPAPMARALERHLTGALSDAARSLLQQVDADQVAERIGQEAETLVRERIGHTVAGWRPELRPLPWWTVPVNVRPG